MRNVVEHPDDPHAPLAVKDFTLGTREPPFAVVQPIWYLRDQPPSAIANDMRVLADNLLTFYEDILVDALKRTYPRMPVAIAEIPEERRDPECPVRLAFVLTTPFPEPERGPDATTPPEPPPT
jgi:hypothetical protein